MKKLLLILVCFLCSLHFAEAQTTFLPQYQTAPYVNTSVSTSTPLPVAVYGGSAGNVLTSNGAGVAATFQAGGGSSSIAIGTTAITGGTSPGLLYVTSGNTVGNVLLNALCGASAFTAAQCASFFGYYDPRWYGATGNGLSLIDITTSATSATISSASYVFTSADNNKNISINMGTSSSQTATTVNLSNVITNLSGAQNLKTGMLITGSGIPGGAKITRVLSTTTLQMSVAATAGANPTLTFIPIVNTTISSTSGGSAILATTANSSVSGGGSATFGTDDASSFQSTINAVSAAGGGTIKLPSNVTFIIGAPLTWLSKVSLIGEGLSSRIYWLSLTDMAGGLIQGLSANYAAPYSFLTFENFSMDLIAATDASYTVAAKAFYMQFVKDSIFQNLYINGSPASSIGIDYLSDVIITANILNDCGRLNTGGQIGGACVGIGVSNTANYVERSNVINNIMNGGNGTTYGVFYECFNCNSGGSSSATNIGYNRIIGNYVSMGFENGNGGYAGIADDGTKHIIITGNTVETEATTGSNARGIALILSADNGPPGLYDLIADNQINGMNNGIDADYSNLNAATDVSLQILNNKVLNDQGSGIVVLTSGTSANTPKNIMISGNQVGSSGGTGYLFSGTAPIVDLSFTNNMGYNNAQTTGTATRKSGVSINVPITRARILGNVFFDNSMSTQLYGMIFNTGAVTGIIENNDFTGNATSAFNFPSTGSFTGIVDNNAGTPVPLISGCGTVTGISGNGDIGQFTANATSCTATITPYGTTKIIANNGYVCNGNDLTSAFVPATGLGLITQTASTTTSATLFGLVNSSDIINFNCKAW